MTLFPEAQHKAQAEIDALIGDEHRVPSWEEYVVIHIYTVIYSDAAILSKANLPYVECLIKEIYRWYTVVPLALPHRTTEDDEYRGYHIPKGSVVMGNAWYVCTCSLNKFP